MEADGWELATRSWSGGGTRFGSVAPSKRVTPGHSPCLPLVSALNGDHVCPDLAPGLQGRYPGKPGTRNPPDGPEGAGGTGSPPQPIWVSRLPHTPRHPESIKTGWIEFDRLGGRVSPPKGCRVGGIIDCLLLRCLCFLSHRLPALSRTIIQSHYEVKHWDYFLNVRIYEKKHNNLLFVSCLLCLS